jgi:DNA-binding NarL/FixJ family response regulator
MLKEVDEVKDVPIIFLTGVRDAAHINAVLSLHPAGYILKPAKSDVLLDEIEKHIR